MAKTLIIIPTYNEKGNIAPLTQAVFAQLPETNILVIDDNSPDGTGEIADTIAKSDPRVKVMHRAGKLGLGTAYIAGFKYAIEQKYDYAMEMDADFSHDPQYLPDFMKKIESADIVLGSRYVPGGGVENWEWYRRLISLGGSAYSRMILGVPYRDLTGGFKCFRRTALEKIGLDSVRSEGYSFQIEMTYRAHRAGLRITETPIIFRERRAGKSKMSWKIFAEAALMVWKMKFSVP